MGNEYLRSMLTGESRSYGFTIAFWGSGAVLINYFGVPELFPALLFGIGSITGFALLAILALRMEEPKEATSNKNLLIISGIHYLSALLPILVAYSIISLGIEIHASFFLSGMSVSLLYTLLSIQEQNMAEFLNKKV